MGHGGTRQYWVPGPDIIDLYRFIQIYIDLGQIQGESDENWQQNIRTMSEHNSYRPEKLHSDHNHVRSTIEEEPIGCEAPGRSGQLMITDDN